MLSCPVEEDPPSPSPSQVSTLRTAEVSVLPALGQELLQEAVLEVVEGEVAGQLRPAVEPHPAQGAALLLLHLYDALPALTAGLGQGQRVAVLVRVESEIIISVSVISVCGLDCYLASDSSLVSQRILCENLPLLPLPSLLRALVHRDCSVLTFSLSV